MTGRTERAPDLTEPQWLMLLALGQAVKGEAYSSRYASPRGLALLRWPDSEGWNRHTGRHDGRSGARGGTMPMKAATVLHRLAAKGYAYDEGGLVSEWRLTAKGAAAVAGMAPPNQ